MSFDGVMYNADQDPPYLLICGSHPNGPFAKSGMPHETERIVRKDRTAGFDRPCVKTQNKFVARKIDLSRPPLYDFIDTGKGVPTHDFLQILRFDTASTRSGLQFPVRGRFNVAVGLQWVKSPTQPTSFSTEF